MIEEVTEYQIRENALHAAIRIHPEGISNVEKLLRDAREIYEFLIEPAKEQE